MECLSKQLKLQAVLRALLIDGKWLRERALHLIRFSSYDLLYELAELGIKIFLQKLKESRDDGG